MSLSGANRSLLVVGSVALDDIDGPFGLNEDLLGGSGSFVGTAASYFTPRASLIAVVGDDFSEENLQFFKDRNIDISGIQRVKGQTFHWHGVYSKDLSTRETIDTQLGVFSDFNPELIGHHKEAELLFLGNINPELQTRVLNQVKKPHIVAADTMNFWIEGKRDALLETIKRVDILLINDEEAEQLAGEHNLVKAAQIIKDMGPHSVVIKRGDAGAVLFHREGVFVAPALPLAEPKDPTGAGDSFAGGFMGYLSYAKTINAKAIQAAMIYGSVMASFSVEQFSIDGLRNLTTALVQKRFDAFYELSQFDRIVL